MGCLFPMAFELVSMNEMTCAFGPGHGFFGSGLCFLGVSSCLDWSVSLCLHSLLPLLSYLGGLAMGVPNVEPSILDFEGVVFFLECPPPQSLIQIFGSSYKNGCIGGDCPMQVGNVLYDVSRGVEACDCRGLVGFHERMDSRIHYAQSPYSCPGWHRQFGVV